MGIKDAVRGILERGHGTQLAKVDIRSAYRNVPVHPDDRWLSGMPCSTGGTTWENVSASDVRAEVEDEPVPTRIRLNAGIRSDILWWATFMDTWNGAQQHSLHNMWTDASGSFGCGG